MCIGAVCVLQGSSGEEFAIFLFYVPQYVQSNENSYDRDKIIVSFDSAFYNAK